MITLLQRMIVQTMLLPKKTYLYLRRIFLTGAFFKEIINSSTFFTLYLVYLKAVTMFILNGTLQGKYNLNASFLLLVGRF